jgi:hypothetical protein
MEAPRDGSSSGSRPSRLLAVDTIHKVLTAPGLPPSQESTVAVAAGLVFHHPDGEVPVVRGNPRIERTRDLWAAVWGECKSCCSPSMFRSGVEKPRGGADQGQYLNWAASFRDTGGRGELCRRVSECCVLQVGLD